MNSVYQLLDIFSEHFQLPKDLSEDFGILLSRITTRQQLNSVEVLQVLSLYLTIKGALEMEGPMEEPEE